MHKWLYSFGACSVVAATIGCGDEFSDCTSKRTCPTAGSGGQSGAAGYAGARATLPVDPTGDGGTSGTAPSDAGEGGEGGEAGTAGGSAGGAGAHTPGSGGGAGGPSTCGRIGLACCAENACEGGAVCIDGACGCTETNGAWYECNYPLQGTCCRNNSDGVTGIWVKSSWNPCMFLCEPPTPP